MKEAKEQRKLKNKCKKGKKDKWTKNKNKVEEGRKEKERWKSNKR